MIRIVALIALLSATPLSAATLTVTNLTDGGAGSLRQACNDAISGDTIVFDASLAGMIQFGSEIDLGTKELTITGNANATGAPAIELNASSATRLFNTEAPLTVNLLAFASAWAAASEGGAIRIAAGLLTCNGCTFTGCSAQRGGAIGTLTGATSTVVCTDCTFSSNSVNSSGDVQGGAIWATSVTCTNCRFLNNNAFSSSNDAYGGTIYAGDVTCTGCMFSGNDCTGNDFSSTAEGGAIWASTSVTCTGCSFTGHEALGGFARGGVIYCGGSVACSGCMFYGNVASCADTAHGGVIYCGGSVTCINSTFALCATQHLLPGPGTLRGGFMHAQDVVCSDCTLVDGFSEEGQHVFVSGTLTITSCVVSGLSPGSMTNPWFAGGTLISGGYNICTEVAANVPWMNATGDQLATDPMLGPLQDNGGPVHTMCPLPGSPAIDQGGGTTSTTDARGFARPFDIPAIANATDGRDVGAVEFHLNQAPVITAPAGLFVVIDTPRIITAISISDTDAGTGELEISLSVSNGTLTLAQSTGLTFTTGSGTADADMTFTGTLADINAALNGMSFHPASGYLGAAALTIDVDDQGNTGDDGALTDGAVVSITVVPPGKVEVQHGTGPIANGGGIAVNLAAGRSSVLILTLQNIGTGDLTILGVSFSAATNATGAVSTMPASVIAMGEGSQLVVAITPTVTGAYSIDVLIESTDVAGSPYVVTVSGSVFATEGSGGNKDESCSTGEDSGFAWLVLLGVIAVISSRSVYRRLRL